LVAHVLAFVAPHARLRVEGVFPDRLLDVFQFLVRKHALAIAPVYPNCNELSHHSSNNPKVVQFPILTDRGAPYYLPLFVIGQYVLLASYYWPMIAVVLPISRANCAVDAPILSPYVMGKTLVGFGEYVLELDVRKRT
jgi:hypothetical protein